MGVSQVYGFLFGGPHNKDYSILGSTLGSPYFGETAIYLQKTPSLRARQRARVNMK